MRLTGDEVGEETAQESEKMELRDLRAGLRGVLSSSPCPDESEGPFSSMGVEGVDVASLELSRVEGAIVAPVVSRYRRRCQQLARSKESVDESGHRLGPAG